MENSELQLILAAMRNTDAKLDAIHEDVKANHKSFQDHVVDDAKQFTFIKAVWATVTVIVVSVWELGKLAFGGK